MLPAVYGFLLSRNEPLKDIAQHGFISNAVDRKTLLACVFYRRADMIANFAIHHEKPVVKRTRTIHVNVGYCALNVSMSV